MERVPEDDLEWAKPLHEAVRREALEELTAGKCAVRLRKSWLGWMDEMERGWENETDLPQIV